MSATSHEGPSEPESVSSPDAPASAGNRATTLAMQAPVGSYAALWQALRARHGLPPTLTPAEAQAAAEILLRGQAPMGVIKMRSGSQYRGNDTSDRAGTTTIDGKMSLISSLRSDKAA